MPDGDGFDRPGSHHDGTIGQRCCVAGLVGHVDRRETELTLQRRKLLPKRDPEIQVEARERLIEQQYARGPDERSRQSYALLFAAGQLVREPASQMRIDATHSERLIDAFLAVALCNPSRPDNKRQIRPDCEMRPQGKILKHEPDATLVRRHDVSTVTRDVPVVDPDISAIGPLQSGNQAQCCRLPAPARSEYRDAFASGDVER